MIIATAGHVDHGKTTLLQAITGVNADRLPEEKKRGMTIDLGYAYWPQPDGRVPGFIDVPGHEKFLSNMLAGVGGIDHALLVVACDDGVMAQTREHLAILQLTGNPMLTVALTKADRVDEARVDEVERQVKEMLREYGIPVRGRRCVVLGRSNIVGKPMAMLLLQQDGTVTVCHSKTPGLAAITREADILVSAVGRVGLVTPGMVKEGAVVIDVAMNRNSEGRLCGDVDFAAVEPKASYITPVPGGVGLMTRAMLMKNTVKAARLQSGL